MKLVKIEINSKITSVPKSFTPDDIRKYLKDNYDVCKKQTYKVKIENGAVILAEYNHHNILTIYLPMVSYLKDGDNTIGVKGEWIKGNPIHSNGKEAWKINKNKKYYFTTYSKLAIESYQKMSGKQIPKEIEIY